MKNFKKLAIYLDHSEAKLFEYGSKAVALKTIKSDFDFWEKQKVMQKGESHLHNKEQQCEQKYYDSLGDEILNFDQTLLFGNTNAKTELFNFLSDNERFSKIKLKIMNSDKLTDNQQLAFVNNFYSEPISH